MRTRTGQGGFTLLELLVVIAVLGALSGVAVMGVNAFDDQAQGAACAADARAIATAQEAAKLAGGAYLDEATLVSSGYLDDASTLHDVTVAGELYSVVPVGDCIDASSEELAAGEPTDDELTADELAAVEAAQKEAYERLADEEAAARAESAEKAAAEKAAAEEATRAEAEAAEKASAERTAKDAAAEEAAAKDAAAEAAAKEAAEKGVAKCTKGQVDLNSASHKELKTIDHVGGDEATRIIKQRPFASLDELSTIKGLSAKDIADIRKQGRACV
jgi:prepilin-type N-terminal cleavage/methylation domain-containing protein